MPWWQTGASLRRDACSRGQYWRLTSRFRPLLRRASLERGADDLDCVVHVAALTWVDEEGDAKAFAESRHVNIDGTAALMRDPSKAGVKRII